MKAKMLLALVVLLACALFPSACGDVKGCQLCGTTQNDSVTIIDVMAVAGAAGPRGNAITVVDPGLLGSPHRREYVNVPSPKSVLFYDPTRRAPPPLRPPA